MSGSMQAQIDALNMRVSVLEGNNKPVVVPAVAGRVGYTRRTFGPDLTLGSDWFKFKPDVVATQVGKGIMTAGGNNSWGQAVQSALPTGPNSWSGTVFSGGAYFEWVMAFTGAPSITGGWPSLWLADIEKQTGNGGLAHWQGQGADYDRWATINVAEWADDHMPLTVPNQVFHNFHDFYGVVGGSWAATETGYHSNGSPYNLPPGFDLTKPHKYGFLWVPATASTQGYAQWFVDDVRVDSGRCVWNLYNPSAPPPPVNGVSSWSFIDARHLVAIFGSGPSNPLTVSAFSVWQAGSSPPPPQPPPPPPPPGPPPVASPDGTFVTAKLTSVWDNALTAWQITTDAKVQSQKLNASAFTRDEGTGNVTALLKYAGIIYHQGSGSYWMSTPGANPPWTKVADPRLPPAPPPPPPPPPGPPPPPQPAGVPSIAASAGYNTRTFGPGLTLGQNWHVVSGNNDQLANGAILCRGNGNGYNHHVVSCVPGGGPGTAFGGGAYFVARLSFTGTTNQNGGWPAWWSNEIENQDNAWGPKSAWPGKPGTSVGFEPDFMEHFSPGSYGATQHVWINQNGTVNDRNPNFPSIPLSNPSQLHDYGCLWVPATPSSRGFISFDIDGVERFRTSWDYWDVSNPAASPAVSMEAAGPIFDKRHPFLILGTGSTNPMTVVAVSVWQRSASANIVR